MLLDAARLAAVRSVNAVMTATYWEIGRRIVEFEQGGAERAGYGETLLKRCQSICLQNMAGVYALTSLESMRLLYQTYPL